MRTARATLVLSSALLLALAAGCGGSDDPVDRAVPVAPRGPASGTSGPGPATPTEETPTAGTPAGEPASGGGIAATPSSAPAAGGGSTCRTADLAVSAEGTEGAAGHVYRRLVVANRSAGTCVVSGFPGVSFVDAAGAQLGAAADRTGPAGAPVTLPPGGRAAATLVATQPGLQPGCEDAAATAPAANLRVYPPENRESVLVALPAGVEACTDPSVHQLTVGALGPA